MAKQRVINTRFWDDGYISTLSAIEKLLFLYVVTNPLTDLCGAYEIAIKRIVMDTDIDAPQVMETLAKFEAAGKILYKDGWMIVRNFAKHQVNNPKVAKGIERSLSTCPDWVKDRLSIGYHSLSHSYSYSYPNSYSDSDLTEQPKPDTAASPPHAPEPDSSVDFSEYEEEMVRVYREFFPDTPIAPFLQDLIAARVDDAAVWRKALTYWQYNSYRPNSIGKICDYYDELKAGKTNGTTKQSYQDRRAELARQSYERSAEIRRRVEQRDRELSGAALPNHRRQLQLVEPDADRQREGGESGSLGESVNGNGAGDRTAKVV